jgi:hypothetical protein
MEIKKETIYLENSFKLFLNKCMDRIRDTKNLPKEKNRLIRIAAKLLSYVVKSGFKFEYAHPTERIERDELYEEFCSELKKDLDKGIK